MASNRVYTAYFRIVFFSVLEEGNILHDEEKGTLKMWG